MSRRRSSVKEHRCIVDIPARQVRKEFRIHCELEFVKARALHALSSGCGFRAPRPIGRSGSVITYEWLDTRASVREPYLRYLTATDEPQRCLDLICDAGRALAGIHSGLSLPRPQHWHPPRVFLRALEEIGVPRSRIADLPSALLHCDFGFANVLYRQEHDRAVIAVFDCSANGYLTTHPCTFGPIYVDIGQFLASLEGLVKVRRYWRMKWRRLDAVREAFLSGYAKAGGAAVDPGLARRFGFAAARCYFHACYPNALKRALAMRVLYNGLKGNTIEPPAPVFPPTAGEAHIITSRKANEGL